MLTTIYNYRSGNEIIPDDFVKNIIDIIESMNPQIRRNTASEIRQQIIDRLSYRGWSGEYRLDINSKITITSYQAGIGLCLQTGNVSRVYADLLKLQALYLKGNIRAGILILPKGNIARKLASNMANYERLLKEMNVFHHAVTVPLIVIGFDKEDYDNE